MGAGIQFWIPAQKHTRGGNDGCVRLNKHIFLTGFMGTGKSTVGPRLASFLGLPFLDTDKCLETRLKKTIAQIFSKKGEPFFRKEEAGLLLEFFQKPPHVASLGGGIILAAANRDVLRIGTWINLKASIPTILKRAGSKKIRPLLGKKIRRDTVDALLKERQSFYDMAPHQIETDSLSVDGVVIEIMKIIRRHCERSEAIPRVNT